MKLSISTKPEAVKDGGSGASFITTNTADVFPVTIKFVSVQTAESGAVSLNFTVDYKGNQQTIYGPYIKGKDGKDLSVGMSLLNKLGVIAGMRDGDELDIEEETHKVGKDQKAQAFEVITNFSGLECQLHIQRRYQKYEGKVSESLSINNVFTKDGASASEVVSGDTSGKQLALTKEKYCASAYYDGVTPEEVTAFLAAKAANREASSKTPVAATSSLKSSIMFD